MTRKKKQDQDAAGKESRRRFKRSRGDSEAATPEALARENSRKISELNGRVESLINRVSGLEDRERTMLTHIEFAIRKLDHISLVSLNAQTSTATAGRKVADLCEQLSIVLVDVRDVYRSVRMPGGILDDISELELIGDLDRVQEQPAYASWFSDDEDPIGDVFAEGIDIDD